MIDLSFYKGKRVFVTGHTGFKGSWLCHILKNAGALVTGYSLEPPTEPNLFSLASVKEGINSIYGDIRCYNELKVALDEAGPEVVFHLAAQPIVRDSYLFPRLTYETNIMGTVNLLECVRQADCVMSVVNVTTDKVYYNSERGKAFSENMPLDGFDPYSNSKSCSELVTRSYKRSFFFGGDTAVSTARAGNVVGGGDFSKDRIIPDCIRAAVSHKQMIVRNPESVRPYQHVLEPIFAYLTIAKEQAKDSRLSGSYNIGPEESDCLSTSRIVSIFSKYWDDEFEWTSQKEANAPHEAGLLRLDCESIKKTFGWKPRYTADDAIKNVVAWTKVWHDGGDIVREMNREINEFTEVQGG